MTILALFDAGNRAKLIWCSWQHGWGGLLVDLPQIQVCTPKNRESGLQPVATRACTGPSRNDCEGHSVDRLTALILRGPIGDGRFGASLCGNGTRFCCGR